MTVSNIKLNDTIYSLMENPAKKPKANERWMAICPMKGDSKWFAKTRELLVARLEEEEGVTAAEYKPSSGVLWQSSALYNDKPIVTWRGDGVMDVDTPHARFRIEMGMSCGRRLIDYSGATCLSEEENYDNFVEALLSDHGASCLRGTLTKIRLKNPDGSTLRDVDVQMDTEISSDITPAELLNTFVYRYYEDRPNPIVELVAGFFEDSNGVEIRRNMDLYTTEVVEEAFTVFKVVDALIFLEENCEDGESCTNSELLTCHGISSEEARNTFQFLREISSKVERFL